MILNRPLDHIVYVVPDLEKACNQLELLLGIRPVFGGHHLTKGTKNALLNLGNGCYLELLAIDKKNKKIKAPRWMGVDVCKEARITRWAIKSTRLKTDSKILQKYDSKMGHIDGGQRKTQDSNLLKWKMILPLAKPAIEVLPFMVDWGKSSVHPTNQLEEACQLVGLKAYHPDPKSIQATLNALDVGCVVQQSPVARLIISIDSPRGLVELS